MSKAYYDKLLGRLRDENPSSGGSGESVSMNPAVTFTVLDVKFGRCVRLDGVTPLMTFLFPVWEIAKLRLRIVSAAEECAGSIVLVPAVDGVELAPKVIPVGAVPAKAEFELPATGQLTLRRDWQNSEDTLKDGDPVAALILNWELIR